MFGVLYPIRTAPTATGAIPWLALAITGAVLIALVVAGWMATRRRQEQKAEVVPAADIRKAA